MGLSLPSMRGAHIASYSEALMIIYQDSPTISVEVATTITSHSWLLQSISDVDVDFHTVRGSWKSTASMPATKKLLSLSEVRAHWLNIRVTFRRVNRRMCLISWSYMKYLDIMCLLDGNLQECFQPKATILKMCAAVAQNDH